MINIIGIRYHPVDIHAKMAIQERERDVSNSTYLLLSCVRCIHCCCVVWINSQPSQCVQSFRHHLTNISHINAPCNLNRKYNGQKGVQLQQDLWLVQCCDLTIPRCLYRNCNC